MCSRWKFVEEVGELIERRSDAQPCPYQFLKPDLREFLGDAAGEAGQVIAHVLCVLASLYEVPVRKLLGLGDLDGRQSRDRGLPRLLLLLTRSFIGLALGLRALTCGVLLTPAVLLGLRLADRLLL